MNILYVASRGGLYDIENFILKKEEIVNSATNKAIIVVG